jgi:hypothetical protein
MGDIDPGGKVDFDFDGSLELAEKLWALAEELEREDRGRQRQGETALDKWRGPYATQFGQRRATEEASAQNVVAGLRADARAWAAAWVDAMEQQNKNNRAAKVDQVREDRNLIEKGWDKYGFGEDDSESEVDAAERPEQPRPPGFTPTATFQDF